MTFDQLQNFIVSPRTDQATVVAVCNVHSIMTARRNPRLSEALDHADVATPDGMPLVWGLRALGHEQKERVFGSEVMRRALVDANPDLNHYFYGSSPETLHKLEEAARNLNSDVRIAGTYSPPYRPLTADDEYEVLIRIAKSEANVVWVGLGMPKQELWMHKVKERLPGVTLIGVGAAFDFIAGSKRQAPSWMQRSGLEWLYRLLQEPRRLWRRYLWNNPAFLASLGVQVASQRWFHTQSLGGSE